MHYQIITVAPLVGAWIETQVGSGSSASLGSHPSWVRGLKLFVGFIISLRVQSHPSWVRGLKQTSTTTHRHRCVAPLVGAWIETSGGGASLVAGVRRTPRGCVD